MLEGKLPLLSKFVLVGLLLFEIEIIVNGGIGVKA